MALLSSASIPFPAALFLSASHCRAHGVSPSYPVQLSSSGKEYNEGMLRGLDYFLSEAGKRGIKVGQPHKAHLPGRGWPPPCRPVTWMWCQPAGWDVLVWMYSRWLRGGQ